MFFMNVSKGREKTYLQKKPLTFNGTGCTSYLHLVVHTAHLGPHCGLRDMPEVLTAVLGRKKLDQPRASDLPPEHILQAHSESISMHIRRPEANYSRWMLGSKHWFLKFLA